MRNELVRAIERISKCLEDLESDFYSKSPLEQEQHLYRSVMTVLDGFLDDADAAVAIEQTLCGMIRRPMNQAA